jgi:hypothetical protein
MNITPIIPKIISLAKIPPGTNPQNPVQQRTISPQQIKSQHPTEPSNKNNKKETACAVSPYFWNLLRLPQINAVDQ